MPPAKNNIYKKSFIPNVIGSHADFISFMSKVILLFYKLCLPLMSNVLILQCFIYQDLVKDNFPLQWATAVL